MATNANAFLVNIVDVQNIANSITGSQSGSAGLSQVQQDIANIQTMVDVTTRTISIDVLSNYTASRDIQVVANLNLSNAALYSNSNLVSFSTTGSASGIPGITQNSPSSLVFTVAGDTALQITSTGNLVFTSSPTYFSTGVDIAGWLYVSESAFVKNLFQTSDASQKHNIAPFFTTVDDVLKITPRRFNWNANNAPDIGFIAQEVGEDWPELLATDARGSIGLAYSRFIPLLLESIRELNTRVAVLEGLRSNT
jgi:hypothetical protein